MGGALNYFNLLASGAATAAVVAFVVTTVLTVKSIKDFSHAGPQIEGVIRTHYLGYVALAMLRLIVWIFLINWWMAFGGVLSGFGIGIILSYEPSIIEFFCWATLGWTAITSFAFLNTLFSIPGVLASNSNYRISRFYRLRKKLNEDILSWFSLGLRVAPTVILILAILKLTFMGEYLVALAVLIVGGVTINVPRLANVDREPLDSAKGQSTKRPNILMIGCDTLRADRLGVHGYSRDLTPTIDRLAREGISFSNCFVPIPRTAPSLITLFSGTWPQFHGVRDNFSGADSLCSDVKFFPKILRENGYATKTISDWAGCDFSKYDFGFEEIEGPSDQWNLKYLIRQGPKDIRLFLSLFCNNPFGKRFLPELYYLAGNPLTGALGLSAREFIDEVSESGRPFFLNLFCATAHPPFSVEYPYFEKYADSAYDGESKYSMSKLTDPLEIIAAQQRPKESFDMQQIKDLYDGCVKRFDDEVSKLIGYLEGIGLRENTIIVVYSDHGIELFENDTWGQGNSVKGGYSARVPLVISDPRLAPVGLQTATVRTVDFASTILDLVDIPPPSPSQGESLVPLFRTEGPVSERKAYTETGIWIAKQPNMSEHHLNYPDILKMIDVVDYEVGTLEILDEFQDIVIAARDRILRYKNWGLIYQPLLENEVDWKLYDVENDPDCEHPLNESYPQVLAELKGTMEDWL